MKNLLTLIHFMLFCSFYYSQVGINTNVPKAMLHIDAKNSVSPESSAGLGVPIVNQLSTSNPTNLQNGMMVYLQADYSEYLKGYYYWDAAENRWEYIMGSDNQDLDFSKVIATGNAFSPSNIIGKAEVTRQVPFTSLTSLMSGFSITPNGELKVGETSTYYLVFTGAVFKDAQDVVNDVKTSILINGVGFYSLSSVNSIPGGENTGRGATFYITSILQLNKNDLLSVITTKEAADLTSTISVNTPYTINLINLK